MTYSVYFSTMDGVRMKPFLSFLKWLVRCLTGSRIVHCAIGDGEVVLSSDITGNHFWPEFAYSQRYYGLVAVVLISGVTSTTNHLLPYEAGIGKPKRCWPTLLRWLRRGEGPLNNDCLCTVLAVLIAIGVPVPRNISTPIGLLRWLKTNGYDYRERRTCATAYKRRSAYPMA